MALFSRHKELSFQWGIWKIDESLDELLALMPRKEFYVQQLQRFTSPHRQLEWLATRVLLCQLLGAEKEIAYTTSGKPYLADQSYHISISHTKGYVAVILSAQSVVGIDIERYGQRVCKVAPKFMAINEVAGTYQGDDTWGLLLHWCAKEVMFKCIDTPQVDFRTQLHVAPFAVQQQGSFQAQEYRTQRQHCFTIHYLIHPTFVITYAIGQLRSVL